MTHELIARSTRDAQLETTFKRPQSLNGRFGESSLTNSGSAGHQIEWLVKQDFIQFLPRVSSCVEKPFSLRKPPKK